MKAVITDKIPKEKEQEEKESFSFLLSFVCAFCAYVLFLQVKAQGRKEIGGGLPFFFCQCGGLLYLKHGFSALLLLEDAEEPLDGVKGIQNRVLC